MSTFPVSKGAANVSLSCGARPELEFRVVDSGRRKYVHVKDPVSLRYFQLREEEFFILQQLDGSLSLDDVHRRFERHFAPRTVSKSQLQTFIQSLFAQGLITMDRPGQGVALYQRKMRLRARQKMTAVLGVLAIRFPGVDPARFVDCVYPKIRWMFSGVAVTVFALLISAAILMIVPQLETFARKLPTTQAFYTPSNLLLLMIALGLAKILHELGHAMFCKHYGGQCTEIGFMLFVFTPCLYANVSDAWLIKNKWHRIAISSGGMIVESIIAASCTFLWWFSEPGAFHSICFNLMLVCSISTIVFNANPLLKYDGYYILSDLTGIANLSTRAMAALKWFFMRYILGADEQPKETVANHRFFLLTYAISSFVYRVFVISAILWVCYRFLEPAGLGFLAVLLGGIVMTSFIVIPLAGVTTEFIRLRRTSGAASRRSTIGLAALTVVVLAVLAIPLPKSVWTHGMLIPSEGTRVFVEVEGNVVATVQAGQKVRAGEELAELRSYDLPLEITRLTGEVAELESQLEAAQMIRINRSQSGAGATSDTLEETLAKTKDELAQRQDELRKLRIVAPVSGVVFSPFDRPDDSGEQELPGWAGSPIDTENLGALLSTGTQLCTVGNPDHFELIAAVREQDLDLVRVGQRVSVVASQYPGRQLRGKILEISETDLGRADQRLFVHGELPTQTDEHGIARPVDAVYRARIALDPSDLIFFHGGLAQAKIHVSPISIGTRLRRWCLQTFRFEF